MSLSNRIRNVAIVGAGGNVGAFITQELLRTGRHIVAALTRKDSTARFPEDVVNKIVDYQDPSTFVEALKGQDALVITMSFWAPKDSQEMIIEAAAKAKVRWIMPNEWCPDTAHKALVQDLDSISGAPVIQQKIRDLGESSLIAVTTGLWYDWCLAVPEIFGIDIINRKAVLFDEGRNKISTTTWPQIGRAVAALLSLPIKPENNTPEKSLEHFRNRHAYIASFNVSQSDIMQSVYRATQTVESDWDISSQSCQARFDAALDARKLGDRTGLGRQIYCRVFFDDGAGNHEQTRGLVNGVLDLPQENIDDFTRLAVVKQTAKHGRGD